MIISSKKFEIRRGVLEGYRGNESEIYVPDEVCVIGSRPFEKCTALERITVGGGVKAILNEAFCHCSALERVDITDLRSWCLIERGNERSAPFCRSKKGDIYLDRKPITHLTVSADIERVGDYAFAYCQSLEEVTVEGEFTDIGKDAFGNCPSLKRILYSGIRSWFGAETVERSICDGAGNWELFADGKAVSEVVVPERVTHIPAHLFDGCKSIVRVILHGGIRSIGAGAFNDCPNLEYVEIGDAVNWCSIDGGDGFAFPESNPKAVIYLKGERVEGIRIPEGVERIGAYRFAYLTLGDEFTIPESVKFIGEGAFFNTNAPDSCIIPYNAKLKKVLELPSGIAEIGNNTFAYSEFQCVVLPSGVGRIGNRAFENCAALKSIEIPDSVSEICENAFLGCSALRTVKFGSGLIHLRKGAFKECSSLRSALLPDSVRNIEEYAFYGCDALKTVAIPDGVSFLPEFMLCGCPIDTMHISLRKLRLTRTLSWVDKKGGEMIDFAFRGFIERYALGQLKKDDLNEWADFVNYGSGKFVEKEAADPYACRLFIDKGLISFERAEQMLQKVTRAETRVMLLEFLNSRFQNSDGDGYRRFDFDAFKLDDDIGTEEDESCADAVGEKRRFGFLWRLFRKKEKRNAAVKVINNDDYEFEIRDGVVTLKKYLGEAVNAVIPRDLDGYPVRFVGDGAFRWNSKIESVEIPEGVLGIGKLAFDGCVSLSAVTLPESLTALGEGAFRRCTSLSYIELPYGVTELSKGAFCGCSKLRTVSVGETLENIRAYALADCSLLESFYANGVRTVEDFAFMRCGGLGVVEFGEVTSFISETAFFGRGKKLYIKASSNTCATEYAKKMKIDYGVGTPRRPWMYW